MARFVFLLVGWLVLAGWACQRSAGESKVPPGMIAMFESGCPEGWTHFEPLDGRLPRGAQQAGGLGGSEEHRHAFDLDAHTSKEGEHEHALALGEMVEIDYGFFGHVGVYKGYIQAFEEGGAPGARIKVGRAMAKTDPGGGHDHLMNVQGDSRPASSLPPFLELVFCRKN